jgi:hypothetical protein
MCLIFLIFCAIATFNVLEILGQTEIINNRTTGEVVKLTTISTTTKQRVSALSLVITYIYSLTNGDLPPGINKKRMSKYEESSCHESDFLRSSSKLLFCVLSIIVIFLSNLFSSVVTF